MCLIRYQGKLVCFLKRVYKIVSCWIFPLIVTYTYIILLKDWNSYSKIILKKPIISRGHFMLGHDKQPNVQVVYKFIWLALANDSFTQRLFILYGTRREIDITDKTSYSFGRPLTLNSSLVFNRYQVLSAKVYILTFNMQADFSSCFYLDMKNIINRLKFLQ